MADLIVVCHRRPSPVRLGPSQLRHAALRLAPDGVRPREPLIVEAGGIVLAVADADEEGVRLQHQGSASRGAACIGGLFGDPVDWYDPGSPPPDGTYALVRWDERRLQLVSDVCGTRSLWFAAVGDVFVAATSQRALVTLLGDFEPCPEAVSWMLASGTLGPEVSWDARVRKVPPDGRVTLDRAAWTISETAEPVRFVAAPGTRVDHVDRLRQALRATCAHLGVDVDRWVLPLSGGRDSRVLLGTLAALGLRPHCVTWTTRASLRNPLSDASIARRIARRLGAEHELLYLDESRSDTETVLSRFVAADEGRNDEIGAYADGMAMWRRLRDAGVAGIIRGDESYGMAWRAPTPENARRANGCVLVEDFPPAHVVRRLGLAPQHWPERLRIAEGEDRLLYRLRMSQHSYIPVLAAGLNEPKARHLEIINPHLSRRVIGSVRALPKDLIRGGTAFAVIAAEQTPGIPLGRFQSTPALPALYTSPGMVRLVVDELTSERIERVLTGDARQLLLTALAAPGEPDRHASQTVKAVLKKAAIALPVRVRVRMEPPWKGPDPLPPALLAFRALLASRTMDLLTQDAAAGRQAAASRERSAP